jgi:hypothetical protein
MLRKKLVISYLENQPPSQIDPTDLLGTIRKTKCKSSDGREKISTGESNARLGEETHGKGQ